MGNNQAKANDSALSEAQMSDNHLHDSSSHPKIKPILKSRTTWRCLSPFDTQYINKYKPKMISHITVTNLHSRMAGTRSIRSLRKALIDSKRVSSLRIDKLDVTSKELISLFSSTNHWKKFSFPFTTIKQLTEIASRFGRCKDLTSFPLNYERQEIPILQDVDPETLYDIQNQFRRLNKLENLVLDIPLSRATAILNHKPSRSLQHIHLNFQNKTGFSQRELSTFLTSLQQQCQKLEYLWLDFSQAYRIEHSDVQIWTSFFQNAPNSLKKLTLSLLFHPHQQPEEMQAFIESLKHLKNLTFLNLDFLGSLQINHPLILSDGFFPVLFTTAIQSMTQLEELRLNLACFSTFKSTDCQHLASMLPHLLNLKNFYINLAFLQSPNEDFVTLSQSLNQLNNIQILDLKFADKNLTHKSIEFFSNNIAHLNLSSLTLNHNNMSPDMLPIASFSLGKLLGFWKRSNLIPFSSDIGSFTEISHLNIGLAAFEISPKESKYLAHVLKQLTKLSSLCLNLPRIGSPNNFEGLQDLVSCFKDLPKLTDLALTFEQEICDLQVRILSQSLIGCKSLRSLSLTFNSASQLHDISLYSLCHGIKSLSNLDILHLDFGTCEIFNDYAVIEFLYMLTALKNLGWLNFIFNSAFLRNRVSPVPVHLKGFYKMKHLRHFVAGPSHFI